MKKSALILILAGLLLSALPTRGQVQYLSTFPYSGIFTKLEQEGDKFYVMDVPAEQCRIYNADLTPWKTIQLSIPNNRWLADIEFLSQHLFDTDDGIEFIYVYYQYVQTSTSYYYVYTTCLYDDTGSVILEIPGGSWSEITNIGNDGSRLMVYVYDYSVYPYTVETKVYRLPGQFTGIPETAVEGSSMQAGTLFPNPSNSSVTLRVPDRMLQDQAYTVVLDSGGKVVLRQPVTQPTETIDLKSLGLPAGTYYLRLESGKLQTNFQKVILAD